MLEHFKRIINHIGDGLKIKNILLTKNRIWLYIFSNNQRQVLSAMYFSDIPIIVAERNAHSIPVLLF